MRDLMFGITIVICFEITVYYLFGITSLYLELRKGDCE
jgi:hypothetical protein